MLIKEKWAKKWRNIDSSIQVKVGTQDDYRSKSNPKGYHERYKSVLGSFKQTDSLLGVIDSQYQNLNLRKRSNEPQFQTVAPQKSSRDASARQSKQR